MPDNNDKKIVPLKSQSEEKYLSVTDLLAEGIPTQKGPQTILDLFKTGILHAHKMGGDTARTKLTLRESAVIRIAVYEKLRTNGRTKAQIGAAFSKVCGPDDEFILSKLKTGVQVNAIIDELIKQARAVLS